MMTNPISPTAEGFVTFVEAARRLREVAYEHGRAAPRAWRHLLEDVVLCGLIPRALLADLGCDPRAIRERPDLEGATTKRGRRVRVKRYEYVGPIGTPLFIDSKRRLIHEDSLQILIQYAARRERERLQRATGENEGRAS